LTLARRPSRCDAFAGRFWAEGVAKSGDFAASEESAEDAERAPAKACGQEKEGNRFLLQK